MVPFAVARFDTIGSAALAYLSYLSFLSVFSVIDSI
jgi:hypothetical protein